jgi:SAM-dependent methyltransferase
VKAPTDHFSAVAPAYASRRPHYPEELFEYVSRLCSGWEWAWDCAAGTGQASLPLTRSFRRVVATDLSPSMLARGPRHPSISYVVTTAESSGLASACIDLVTVAQALHWLDVERFYREVDRVLVSGGVLAVWSYGNQTVGEPRIDQTLSIYYHEIVGRFWPPERRHVESGYRTLPFPYPELDPPSFAMEQRWSLEQLLGYIGTWSATERCREATGRDPVEELRQQLKPLWGDPASVRFIRWPLSLRVGRRPG